MSDEKEQKEEGISIKKIAENAITTLVAAVFIGACVIVWNGATSVNEKVQTTEHNFQVLIDNLSDKLSRYEIQLISQSNQLQVICKDLTNLSHQVVAAKPLPQLFSPSMLSNTPPKPMVSMPPDAQHAQTEQRAIRADIYQGLSRELKK